MGSLDMVTQGTHTKRHLNEGPVGAEIPSTEWDCMNWRKGAPHPPLNTTANTTTTNNSKALLEFFTQRKQLLTIFIERAFR